MDIRECINLQECPALDELWDFYIKHQQNHQQQQERILDEGVDDTIFADAGNFADDATWILTSSFVILTMQSGFGLLEMGSSAPGNEVNIMMKNVFDVVFGGAAYFCLGYGISFGVPSNPFMGLGDFFPNGGKDSVGNGLLYSSYLFQLSFAATSTTIVSGCVAMRMRFFVYCAFAFYAVVVYAFCAHWTWADDGWLLQMGYHDFAGSGPVHLFGAMNGYMAILQLGPRYGRFDGKRPFQDFRESSPTSILFGLFMLWWGWIGFNCGSSFGITDDKWLVATRAAVTTISSTAGGGLAALAYTQVKTKSKFVLAAHVANGILGALVASSACCASIRPVDSLVVGAIGALISNATNDFLKTNLQIDDPVGAIGVHGTAAIWGIMSVGLFADDTLSGVEVQMGLLRGGGFDQMIVQLIGIGAFIGWSIATVAPFFYITGVVVGGDWRNPRKGLRMTHEEEMMGADIFFHDAVSEAAVAKSMAEQLELQTQQQQLLQQYNNSRRSRRGSRYFQETKNDSNNNNNNNYYSDGGGGDDCNNNDGDEGDGFFDTVEDTASTGTTHA